MQLPHVLDGLKNDAYLCNLLATASCKLGDVLAYRHVVQRQQQQVCMRGKVQHLDVSSFGVEQDMCICNHNLLTSEVCMQQGKPTKPQSCMP